MTLKQNFIETVKWRNAECLVTDLTGLILLIDPMTGSFDEEMKDEWGCQWGYADKEINPFPCVIPGNPIITNLELWREQLIKIPDPSTFDYSVCRKNAEAVDRDNYLVGISCSAGLFERCHDLMGFEESLIAFLEEPEAMGELLDCIMDYKIAYIDELYKVTEYDLFYFHDDWGTKHSLFMAPAVWREFIKPRETKIVQHAKSKSKSKEILYMHHSDTFLEPLVPDMIEMGIDIWQGVIPQNDIVKLQKIYRGQIAFHGGIDIAAIDNEYSTEEQIRGEVRRAIDTYGPYGGIMIGIPSLAAIYPRVQEVYDDEMIKYSKIFNDKNFK